MSNSDAFHNVNVNVEVGGVAKSNFENIGAVAREGGEAVGLVRLQDHIRRQRLCEERHAMRSHACGGDF